MTYNVNGWKELADANNVDKEDLVIAMENDGAETNLIAIVNGNLDGDSFDNNDLIDIICSYIEDDDGAIDHMYSTQLDKETWVVTELRRDGRQ